ncbi:MAG: formylglycine-generating enzyme family protein [Magnetococcales bacterium]|nr:formylglycine-generating enzyme family protein [Magnetococcales bacterium]
MTTSALSRSILGILLLLLGHELHAADARETIRALAASAEKDLHARRFTQPSGMNALEKYQKILALEPDHPLGWEGIRKIVTSFQRLAKEAEQNDQPNLARQRTLKAQRVQTLLDQKKGVKRESAKKEESPHPPRIVPPRPPLPPEAVMSTPPQPAVLPEALPKAVAKSDESKTPPADAPELPGSEEVIKPPEALPKARESGASPAAPTAAARVGKPVPPEPVAPAVPAEPAPPEPPPKIAPKAESPAALRTRAEPVTGIEFVEIPGGCFKMGSEQNDPDEKPVHEVCVASFWMGRTEVTNGQYRRFDPKHDSTAYDGRDLNSDLQPVVNVTWEQANQFARWMSGRGGVSFRLPTEAEWEYAARDGSTSAFPWGDTPAEGCRYANVGDNTAKQTWPKWNVFPCTDGYAETAPVGMFLPNRFGLYDMIGNVWEWVADWYSPGYYSAAPRDNPKGPTQGFFRGARGGSWAVWPDYARTANRTGIDPAHPDLHVGFRLVMVP